MRNIFLASQTTIETASSHPLFPTEEEIATLFLGPYQFGEWKRIAVALEALGMPKKNPVVGRRYLPAVRAFLDQQCGFRTTESNDANVGPTGYRFLDAAE